MCWLSTKRARMVYISLQSVCITAGFLSLLPVLGFCYLAGLSPLLAIYPHRDESGYYKRSQVLTDTDLNRM